MRGPNGLWIFGFAGYIVIGYDLTVSPRKMRSITVAATLLVLLTPCFANAALIITVRDDGAGGAVARFQGSGVTEGTIQTAQGVDAGNFATIDSGLYVLANPVAFVPGIEILWLGLDDDSANPNPSDDFGVIFSGVVPNGTNYSVDGESVLNGMLFSTLMPGSYLPQITNGFPSGDFRLVIADSQAVPVPATLALFALGLAGIGLKRKQEPTCQ